MKPLVLVFFFMATCPLMAQERTVFFDGSETKFMQIKAKPTEYVGKPVVLTGEIKFDESFADNGGHYLMTLNEIIDGGNGKLLPGEDAHLYINAQSNPIVKTILEKLKGEVQIQIVRVKAVIDPKKNQNVIINYFNSVYSMELIDLQFPQDGKWTPWLVDQAKRNKEEAEIQAIKQRMEILEKEKTEKIEKKRVAQTRTWKDKSGKFSIQAEFVGYFNGIVRLKRVSDGVIIKVSLEMLSQECNDWVSEILKKQ